MRVINLTDAQDELKFLERAAAEFEKDHRLYSYSDNSIIPGERLAIRWNESSILALQISDIGTPTVYASALRAKPQEYVLDREDLDHLVMDKQGISLLQELDKHLDGSLLYKKEDIVVFLIKKMQAFKENWRPA